LPNQQQEIQQFIKLKLGLATDVTDQKMGSRCPMLDTHPNRIFKNRVSRKTVNGRNHFDQLSTPGPQIKNSLVIAWPFANKTKLCQEQQA